jgi:hypothetical protein
MSNAVATMHLYSAAPLAVTNEAAPGWVLEGVEGLVFVTQEESTVQFYRLVSASDNFYTISTTERDNAIQNGYRDASGGASTAYIYPTEVCGSVPLYRLHSDTKTDNIYTTSKSERVDLITEGYTDMGVAGYVVPLTSDACS